MSKMYYIFEHDQMSEMKIISEHTRKSKIFDESPEFIVIAICSGCSSGDF